MADCKKNSDFHTVLKQIAQNLEYDSSYYTLDLDNSNIIIEQCSRTRHKLESLIFKAKVHNRSAQTSVNLVIKKAPKNTSHILPSIELLYQNEIHFYSAVCPRLKAFEEQHGILESLLPVAEFITSDSGIGKNMVILGDLHDEGYELCQPGLIFNQEHINLIFKTYGHFHATSFCFKQRNHEQFQELIQSFRSIFEIREFFEVITNDAYFGIKHALEMLSSDTEKHLIEKLQLCLLNIKEICYNGISYEGKHGCLLHGQCFESKMMFKYNVSIKLRSVYLY